MSDNNNELKDQISAIKSEVELQSHALEEAVNNYSNMSETDILDYLYHLKMIWADFHLYIVEPLIDIVIPDRIINPKVFPDGEIENVFVIHDEGFRLSTSRGAEGIALGHSLLKYYNTIEKMIAILVKRIDEGGFSKETEIRVAFYGHELGQRKAFESVLNLEHNVVVTNFDGGEWADRLMNMVLTLADRGFGLPPSSPRKSYLGPNSL